MALNEERIVEVLTIERKMRDCQNRDKQLNKVKNVLDADSYLTVSVKNTYERIPDDLDLEFRQLSRHSNHKLCNLYANAIDSYIAGYSGGSNLPGTDFANEIKSNPGEYSKFSDYYLPLVR